MTHLITHTLIALIGMVVIGQFGSYQCGAGAMALFYTVREFYQYFILHKRHRGRFDHEGYIGPVVLWLATLLYNAL